MFKSGITILSVLLLVSFNAYSQEKNVVIENCHVDGVKAQVKCGKLSVPENYNKIDGEQISINFVVLPAIDDSDKKTPLMFLAGGPGQAAAELASGLRQVFNEVRKTRDLILVDQRGTGESHPLQCEESLEQNPYEITPEEFSEQDIKDCLASFSGDLSQYNSENAIRDFDAVRVALGHKQINIYGGSYGTRAGLVYMRMFPNALRSVVLDSVGPIEVPIGLFGQSSARSFNLLVENCQKELSCQKAYPELKQEFTALVARLVKAPAQVSIAHPRLGTTTKFVISKAKLLGTLRMQLYSVATRSLVPLVIHQAYLGNYMPLAGLVAQSEGGQGIYLGLLFNITCNEDYPRISATDFEQDADNDFGGGDSHFGFKMVCPIWPQYRPSEEFYQTVTADIPTLILSGDLDPVTPPSNGDYSAKSLPNNHHIVVENAAHTVAMSTCASDIINEFLTSLKPKELDESCLDDVPNESFMTNLNGGILSDEIFNSEILSEEKNNLDISIKAQAGQK
ncbi:alpha/beta hydrolase [Colwellia sp. 39_35_sub15_T18]|nr:alpha/beta hydrolase [Colwellia sp. 39_35_sub15_T18]